jgi:hypothetical protein
VFPAGYRLARIKFGKRTVDYNKPSAGFFMIVCPLILGPVGSTPLTDLMYLFLFHLTTSSLTHPCLRRRFSIYSRPQFFVFNSIQSKSPLKFRFRLNPCSMQYLKIAFLMVLLGFITVTSAAPLRVNVLAVCYPKHHSSDGGWSGQPFEAGVIEISRPARR